ncbi:MAG TPA: hypothetical protein ENK18_16270 [Deltaproteobacteria bacterium]|nr:hypothetical protein [Deltaproteobacteria bacterium]
MRFLPTMLGVLAVTLTTPAYAQDNLGQLTLRGGYAKYYAFDFITGGAEAAVRVLDNLHVVAGLETYSVNRDLPPDVALIEGQLTKWNTIFPINAGALYKFQIVDIVEPYAGADLILSQYTDTAWAVGARARGGLDVMFIDNLGANVNLALGGWSGQRWEELQPGLKSAGLLPQISGGIVLAL